ncbi:MAG: phosphoribosyl-ATP diphosphatase [Planctomycetota bacterium]|nr:MAG: phosphoribosyl-ATP diphosphatase [Planctomycetota bacterium]
MSEDLNKSNILSSVYQVIQKRLEEKPENSYVVSLAEKGLEKILSKISEESAEVIMAGIESKDDSEKSLDHLNYEICDLFFHTLVLAAYKNISFESIEKEMARRFGTSGLKEKKSRKSN